METILGYLVQASSKKSYEVGQRLLVLEITTGISSLVTLEELSCLSVSLGPVDN